MGNSIAQSALQEDEATKTRSEETRQRKRDEKHKQVELRQEELVSEFRLKQNERAKRKAALKEKWASNRKYNSPT